MWVTLDKTSYCGKKNKKMVRIYKYGFKYKNFNYGWYKKELYRLPSVNFKNQNFPLKKLKLIDVGNKKGYRLFRDKKTLEQLEELTEVINYEYVVNGKQSKDTPF